MRFIATINFLCLAISISGCAAAATQVSARGVAETASVTTADNPGRGAKPLFASDKTIQLRIEAPFTSLIKASPDGKTPFPATLVFNGASPEQHPIKLAPRGRSRRNTEICGFPPLRVIFDAKPGDGSLFDGQKGLKLVTHCRKSSTFEQHALLEYVAYRFFNAITPESLKVRMAEINYFDTEKGKSLITRKAFFIEDADDAAKRNGVKEIDIKDISVTQLNPNAAARYALFQYMISNYDWSMHDSLATDDCCHNTKLIGRREEPLSGLSPVPYDFDHSGLVDSPYAAVPDNIPVRNVRTRRYRGLCRHNDEAIAAAAIIRNNRGAYDSIIDNTPGMKNSAKSKAKRFLNGFFKNIENREAIEKSLLKTCRD